MIFNYVNKISILFFLFIFFFISDLFSSENDKNIKIRKYIQNNKTNISIYEPSEFSKIEKYYEKINLSSKRIIYKKIFDSLYFFDFDHKLINSIINLDNNILKIIY